MYELSLFSGAGGGLLGSRFLGWRTIGYIEWDDYCQRVIARRIRDGFLDNAPICGDIRAFLDSGCAELYADVKVKKQPPDLTAGEFNRREC